MSSGTPPVGNTGLPGRHTRWIGTGLRATGRGLGFGALSLAGAGLLTALAAPLLLALPLLVNAAPSLELLLGLTLTGLGVAAAPWLLAGYGALARAVLTPAGQAELARRVRHLAGPARRRSTPAPRRCAGSSAICTMARRPGWWPWA
jgi:hypothetical protein